MKVTSNHFLKIVIVMFMAVLPIFSNGFSSLSYAAGAQGTVSGKVTDMNNNPIAGAWVWANGSTFTTGSVQTDVNGNYTLPNIDVGTVSIGASKTGYSNGKQPNVEVTAGQTTIVNVQLKDPGAISGRIINDKNVPLFGVYISTYGIGSIPMVTSDADGIYTVPDLSEGTYTVQVYVAGYPGTQKTDIQVTAGQTTTVDFQLTPPGAISGVVTDVNNLPISGANVTVGQYGSALTSAQGKYTISNLNAGAYTVTASKKGWFSTSQQSNVQVNAGKTTTLNFQLKPLASISVNVTDGLNNPVSSATVSAKDSSGVFFTLGKTNLAGNTTYSNYLDAGVYSVIALKTGYSTVQQDNVQLNSGQTTTVNIQIIGISTAPAANSITVTRNPAPTADTVSVAGLTAGDVVQVYDASTGGTVLGTATVAAGKTTATVSAELGSGAGTAYVSVTSPGKTESTRTAKAYVAKPIVQTDAPLDSNITVINNSTPTADTVSVIGLTAGDVVQIYDASTGGTVLGTATVAAGETTGTVSIAQLGTGAGTVYVTVTSPWKTESTRTAKAYDAEPVVIVQSDAPLASNITVTNNAAPTADTVSVAGLTAGDEVQVYDASTGGTVLGTATVAGGETTATASIDQLGTGAGTVYVSVTSPGKTESTRTAKAYDAEPIVIVQTDAPLASNITVTNNSAPTADTVNVTGLTAGDVVQIYDASSGGTVLGTATVVDGETMAIVTIAQLGTGAGTVYVSVTSPGKTESTRTAKAYDAEPVVIVQTDAPLASNITVTNNSAPTADTVKVSGLTAGDVVQVYDSSSGGSVLGTATVADRETSATVTIAQLGTGAGTVYVSVTSPGKTESTRTAKAYDAEPIVLVQTDAPLASNITVTNNSAPTTDTVKVSGLTAGDVVQVYDASSGGTVLGTATVAAGQTSATVSIAQLGTGAGTVYVSVTSPGKTESTRTTKTYDAEPIVIVQTDAPLESNISVTNNSAPTADTVNVTGLTAGDVVQIYDASSGGTVLGTATVVDGETTSTVSIDQLGTGTGTVYVSVTSPGKTESTRTSKAYDAESNGGGGGIKVKNISLNRTDLTMTEGDSPVRLVASILPTNATNQQVTWSSSNPAVVSVDQDGTVTPNIPGTAVITVTTVDGNKKASCKVTVSAKKFKLKASPDAIFLQPNQTATFTVIALYADGKEEDITLSKDIQYKGNSSIFTVKPGTVTAGKKEGKETIEVIYRGQQCQITVTVKKG
ncbi:beta strand repeat-containing protein [Brevibacillus ginsengisoli]|uniref:beta strand repeat-containing protein n=1 Tax=Brevibacillus ginsengisoli TaxID=363854 RepID=UPI003CEAA92C